MNTHSQNPIDAFAKRLADAPQNLTFAHIAPFLTRECLAHYARFPRARQLLLHAGHLLKTPSRPLFWETIYGKSVERIYGLRNALVHALQHPEVPRAVTRPA